MINNYNYGRYLRESINSVLGQTYQNKEVLVVDDGSTDNSRKIIASYGDTIIPVLKENGGQTSTYNAGFVKSKGTILILLDADDTLLDGALEKIVPLFHAKDIVKVHWPLLIVDEKGTSKGKFMPKTPLSEGDLKKIVVENGPQSYTSSPSSGNAWSRAFLEKIFPFPEIEKGTEFGSAGADDSMSSLAPLFGKVGMIKDPLATYRLHKKSDYSGKSFDAKIRHQMIFSKFRSELFKKHCKNLGVDLKNCNWSTDTWFIDFQEALNKIKNIVPENKKMILLESPSLGAADKDFIVNREIKCLYMEKEEASTIKKLKKLAKQYEFLIIADDSFWIFEHFPQLYSYIHSQYNILSADKMIKVFAQK